MKEFKEMWKGFLVETTAAKNEEVEDDADDEGEVGASVCRWERHREGKQQHIECNQTAASQNG